MLAHHEFNNYDGLIYSVFIRLDEDIDIDVYENKITINGEKELHNEFIESIKESNEDKKIQVLINKIKEISNYE